MKDQNRHQIINIQKIQASPSIDLRFFQVYYVCRAVLYFQSQQFHIQLMMKRNQQGFEVVEPVKNGSFSNPVCQQTYESLPKIYGTLKKRIEVNKNKFYENVHKRVKSNIVRKEEKKATDSSDNQLDLVKNLKKIKEHDHEDPAMKDKVSEKERPTAKFSDKYHKLEEKSFPRQKKKPSQSKQERSSDRESGHKVKLNTLHFLPALQQSNVLSSQNDNFSSLVKEKTSKSVMVNNPLVNLYRSREVDRSRTRMITHQIEEEENSSNGSVQRGKQTNHYTPKEISQSMAKGKEKKNSLRIQTDFSLHSEEQSSAKKGNAAMTEFSRRINTQKSQSNYLSNSRDSHKYKVPSKDEYKEFIQSYIPINAGFSLKKLLPKQTFQIIAYTNAVYFGEIVNKIRKGNGVLISEDSIFEGIFQNDDKFKGFEQNFDGIYVGYFKDGQRQGRGQYSWNNGEIFEGQWKAGKKNGTGIWTSPIGDRYEGEWLNGRQHGNGVHKHKNSTYKGEFLHSLKHGSGQQIFINGDRYKGFYENGKPHGLGRYDWSDGSYYEGEFKNGYREGKGVLSEKNGSYYKVKALSREILSTVLVKRHKNRAKSSRESSKMDHGSIRSQSNSELMFSSFQTISLSWKAFFFKNKCHFLYFLALLCPDIYRILVPIFRNPTVSFQYDFLKDKVGRFRARLQELLLFPLQLNLSLRGFICKFYESLTPLSH